MTEPWPAGCALRALLTGGDRLLRRPPSGFPCRVVNHYGPTECTVVATASDVLPEGMQDGVPPIGRPIANVRTHVLDARLQPVPAGDEGELYIGGEGVARGYLRRSELTRDRFIQDPFSAPSGRLYRTGDLARLLPGGELEFLGRMDDQVKLRGHRIEPGEVEWALVQHPAVRHAAVAALGDGKGTRLIGYLVADSKEIPRPEELSRFLARSLPDYMVPSHFEWLERLPLTPNGKVDRRALPTPTLSAAGSRSTEAPTTESEQALARIWSQVLGHAEIGVNDSFFELGGHSLNGAQLSARIRAEFGISLSVRSLFDHPTIAALAPVVDEARRAAAELDQVPTRFFSEQIAS
jgi:hypothetical protein